jgi:hypothetical protein
MRIWLEIILEYRIVGTIPNNYVVFTDCWDKSSVTFVAYQRLHRHKFSFTFFIWNWLRTIFFYLFGEISE